MGAGRGVVEKGDGEGMGAGRGVVGKGDGGRRVHRHRAYAHAGLWRPACFVYFLPKL